MYHQMNMSALKQVHGNAHMHQSIRKGHTHESIGQITSGHSYTQRAVTYEHPSAWTLMHSLFCPCRRPSSPQNNLNAGSAQCHESVSTRQELGASANLQYVELLVCEVVIILPFICTSSQPRKHRRAKFKLDENPMPSSSPKLVLLVKMLVVDMALFWPLPS